MKIKRMNFAEFESAMYKFNAKHNITSQSGEKQYGVIVFTKDSFNKPFSEAQRSYMVNNLAKAFLPKMIGYSLSGDCLDGTDIGVRLDWYMKDDKKPWKVEYCYIVEDMNIIKVNKETGEEKPVSLYDALCLTEGREYWKAGTVAQMLVEGQEVQTPFAIFKKVK